MKILAELRYWPLIDGSGEALGGAPARGVNDNKRAEPEVRPPMEGQGRWRRAFIWSRLALPSAAHLFVAVRGQVEDEDREERHDDAGEDQVGGVEEGLPSEGHVEGDIWAF